MEKNFKNNINDFFTNPRSSTYVLEDYKEYVNQITGTIKKPTRKLTFTHVASSTVISSGAYYVSNDIIVFEGAELIIEPGVLLYFAEGKGIISFGKLKAIGTDDNQIIISGNKWANISIVGKSSENSSIINTIIEGGHSRRTLPIKKGDLLIDLDESLSGGNLYLENTKVNLKNCIIANGNAEFGGGIFLYDTCINAKRLLIFNNISKIHSGGIHFNCKEVSGSRLQELHVIQNSGFNTGGIKYEGKDIKFENLIIKYNFSNAFCGGINISNTSGQQENHNIQLRNSIIQENFGVICGGLFYSDFDLKEDDLKNNIIRKNTNKSGSDPNIQKNQKNDFEFSKNLFFHF